MGLFYSKDDTAQLCEEDSNELSCNPGEILNVTEAICAKKSSGCDSCKCALPCDDDCDSKLEVVKKYCHGTSSCKSPRNKSEFYKLCGKDGVLIIKSECLPEGTAIDKFSATPDWLSQTSTNGTSAHEFNDGVNVITTPSYADFPNNDRTKEGTTSDKFSTTTNGASLHESNKGAALLDPKVIAGAVVAGVGLLLLLVLIIIVVKRKHNKSTDYEKQITPEEKHNEIYEINANYTEEHGGGIPGVYSTTADFANEVEDSKNNHQNVYACADEAGRDDPSQRNMTENILYGEL